MKIINVNGENREIPDEEFAAMYPSQGPTEQTPDAETKLNTLLENLSTATTLAQIRQAATNVMQKPQGMAVE
jgi:hypothetical protein